MTLSTSITHEWADDAKTIVKRTTIDYPADLVELQTALDEAKARIETLPLPEAYPTQKEYEQKWADTSWNHEQVCRMVDMKNRDNPDVQERFQLAAAVDRIQTNITDWRSKAGVTARG